MWDAGFAHLRMLQRSLACLAVALCWWMWAAFVIPSMWWVHWPFHCHRNGPALATCANSHRESPDNPYGSFPILKCPEWREQVELNDEFRPPYHANHFTYQVRDVQHDSLAMGRCNAPFALFRFIRWHIIAGRCEWARIVLISPSALCEKWGNQWNSWNYSDTLSTHLDTCRVDSLVQCHPHSDECVDL